MFAYGLALYESVEGGSEFLEERFDVNAKAATAPTPGRPGELGGLNIMMQNLLVERFGLVVRMGATRSLGCRRSLRHCKKNWGSSWSDNR